MHDKVKIKKKMHIRLHIYKRPCFHITIAFIYDIFFGSFYVRNFLISC